MSFVELICRSNYSFLTGASHPEELVARAKKLGYDALAITDECSLAGIVKAHTAAKGCGLKLIVGSLFQLQDLDHPTLPLSLVLLAPTRSAYAELSTLITRGRRRSEKGEYHLTTRDFRQLVRECLVIWLPDGNRPADIDALATPEILAQGKMLAAHCPGRLWLGVSLMHGCEDTRRYLALHSLAVAVDIPMTVANDVLMHTRARKPLLDVVTAIRLNTPVQQLGTRLQANAERHLRSLKTLRSIYPEALLAESGHIAARCTFSMDELRYEYPRELVPEGMTATAWLRALTEQGMRTRWPDGTLPKVTVQIEYELALIAELQYEYYFLTVHDIVQYARSQKILCQGRGSAANSAVCFCLGITEVDPARSELLFERFLSRERNEPPDIDVDFEHERREEVIQYIYRKYTREHAALAATLICYRPKSAVRDVGKALGFDNILLDDIARSLGWWESPDTLRKRLMDVAPQADGRLAELFLTLVGQLLGFPRHLSQHVGGFVITRAPIATLVPVENAAMPDRTIIQWDKDDLEAMGLLKVDILALGMLTAIRKTLALLDTPLTLATIPAEDKKTYDMLQRGDSIGVFQVESRAQMAMLPRLKPKKFYDLVVQVAIVRPGPIQGGMVHPYLRRRAGQEAVDYPSEAVYEVLERTLGIPIFQEQVIKLCVVAAGFTPGEADQLRRAMGRWKKTGELEGFRHKLIDGMLNNGYAREYAERIFRQIEGFGEYGFPESHAASFALLVYVSAWLKRHHPAAFCCGLLNSLPMGFYSPSQLIQDAQRHGVRLLNIDIDHSDWDYTLESAMALRIGFRQIEGFGEAAALRLMQARKCRPFTNLQDLKSRAQLTQPQLAALVAANAVRRLTVHRHQGHWEARAIEEEKPLYTETEHANATQLADGIQLTAPSETNDLLADYASMHLTLNRHPMAILRTREPFDRCLRSADLPMLPSGRFVRVAGVVTNRQRPDTASGVLFMTLEDETGVVNLVVWRAIQEKFRHALRGANILLVKGTVESRDDVIHVIAGEVVDLGNALPGFAPASRDFH